VGDPGKLKGRYELKEPLGQGGMGVVYRAYDTVLKSDVAIKMIRDTPDPTALQLFYRECEVLAALKHPNIVPILDMGELKQGGQDKPFFVMPLLPGATLDRVIRDDRQLTVQRSVDILTQVCRGLAAAHERGLVHRDLKPANVFVMPDDSVEIIDFGVAHIVTGTTTGGQKGTLLFMAPELFESKPPSPLSDIFALGVMAYQVFSGRRPFDRPTEREVIEAILHETPPSVSDLDPNVSQSISCVVHKALAKQPWNRFASAREFAECLQKAQRGEPIEYFDQARIRPRIEQAKKAFEEGDYNFASEIVLELETEGHLDPQMAQLRRQIDIAERQKRVQQLLDSARTRLQEDEAPPAMQKVQEALALEPGNPEALGLKAQIEQSSNERQAEGWFRLVSQHIENSAYSHAREALQNVLHLRPEDAQAQSLLAEVDRLEQEQLRTRHEKDLLYQASVEAYKKGEVSSALSKLEKVLDLERKKPDRSTASATYQSFYNEVRVQYDAMRNSYAEARKCLDELNFAKALAICDEFLAKFPEQALFQALKFDIEERRRQRMSSFVAEVDRRVEAEPDLERKENILQEALAQFPHEPHFEGALKLVRNRLTLVQSIVSKARAHEERGQFSEALSQWEILRTIQENYPGMDVEVERLQKRRDQRMRLEGKSQWVEKIDAHLQAADFDKAFQAVNAALAEFAEDPELLALKKLASRALERGEQAQRVLGEGSQFFERGSFEQGLAALKQALELDPRNAAIRSAFTSRLVERARQLLESNPSAASDLVTQALQLDPGNAAAKSIRILLEDRHREELVNQALARVRQLQTAGNIAEALAQIDQALFAFPEESRLKRLRGVLSATLTEAETARLQAEALAQMRALAERAQAGATADQHRELLGLMSRIASRFPLDPEFQSLLESARRQTEAGASAPNQAAMTAGRIPSSRGLEPDATVAFALSGSFNLPAPPNLPPPISSAPPPVSPGSGSVSGSARPLEPDATAVFLLPHADTQKALGAAPLTASQATSSSPTGGPGPQDSLPADATSLFVPAPANVHAKPHVAQPELTTSPASSTAGAPRSLPRNPPQANRPSIQEATPKVSIQALPAWLKLGIVGALLVSLSAGGLLLFRGSRSKAVTTAPASVDIDFQVHTSPPGASILLGQRVLGKSETRLHLPSGQYQLTAQKEGYQPKTLNVDLRPNSSNPYNMTLQPLPADFHLFTPFKKGNLSWDGKAPENLTDDGQFAVNALDTGRHTIHLESGPARITLSFEDQPLTVPVLQRPQSSGIDSVAIATYREDAALVSSIADLPVVLDGQPVGKLNAGRMLLKSLSLGSHTLSIGQWTGTLTAGAAPSLNVYLGSLATQGTLFVEVHGPDDSQVLVNNTLRGVVKSGKYRMTLDPGAYQVLVLHPGFLPVPPQKIVVRQGASARLTFDLVPVPVPAVAPVKTELPAPPKLPGTITVRVTPANAQIAYTRSGQSSSQIFHPPSVDLEAGAYVFTAEAPGYITETRSVNLVAGGSASLAFTLNLKVQPVSPVRHQMEAEEWDQPWSQEGAWYARQGGDFVLYKITPSAGVFHFTIRPKSSKRFLGIGPEAKLHWILDYTSARNYVECQIGKQSYSSEEYRDGKKIKHAELRHEVEGPVFQLQVTLAPTRMLVQILSSEGKYETLDEWNDASENYTRGQFGFRIPNQDQLYLSNFLFEQSPGAH